MVTGQKDLPEVAELKSAAKKVVDLVRASKLFAGSNTSATDEAGFSI